MKHALLVVAIAIVSAPIAAGGTTGPIHDTIIRNGLIYDGSGTVPYVGDVAIDGDRIAFVGKHARGHGRAEVDAHGKAITPGFINMLAHTEESLLIDGRALSDLAQNEVAMEQRRRRRSVRACDHRHRMMNAEVEKGTGLESRIDRFLSDPCALAAWHPPRAALSSLRRLSPS